MYLEKIVQKMKQATSMNSTLALLIRVGEKPETTKDWTVWQLTKLCYTHIMKYYNQWQWKLIMVEKLIFLKYLQ